MIFPCNRLGDLQNDFALTVASTKRSNRRRRYPDQFREDIRFARKLARAIRRMGGALPKRPRFVHDAYAFGGSRLVADMPVPSASPALSAP